VKGAFVGACVVGIGVVGDSVGFAGPLVGQVVGKNVLGLGVVGDSVGFAGPLVGQVVGKNVLGLGVVGDSVGFAGPLVGQVVGKNVFGLCVGIEVVGLYVAGKSVKGCLLGDGEGSAVTGDIVNGEGVRTTIFEMSGTPYVVMKPVSKWKIRCGSSSSALAKFTAFSYGLSPRAPPRLVALDVVVSNTTRASTTMLPGSNPLISTARLNTPQ